MPYANNDGVKIYYEVEGEGPPVVLLHGATEYTGFWRRRPYVETLRNDYKLILIDFRGHGRSDKPQEASGYGPNMTITMASDVVSVLDDLGLAKVIYYGFSMGGMVGFRAALRYPDRFHAFILGAISPYAYPEGMTKGNRFYIEAFKVLRNDPESFLREQERTMNRQFTSEERERWLSADPAALSIVLASMIDLPALTDTDLAGISAPCLVYCGDQDLFYPGASRCVTFMPNVKFVALSGLNHGTAFQRYDLVLPQIKEFLAKRQEWITRS
jgi:pimeloyl-ACP methyl ester carboxylesterase